MATKRLAFYTIGDKSAADGPQAIIRGKKRTVRMEDMSRLRARTLVPSGHAYGVATVEAAIVQLRKLEKGAQVTKVYFVGHGLDGGFFFSGKAVNDDFEAYGASILSSDSPRMQIFVDELARILSKDEAVEIAFLSCYTGIGKFTGDFYRKLRAAGIEHLIVGAYRDYYEQRYAVNPKGEIVRWDDRIITAPGDEKALIEAHNNQIPRYQVMHTEPPELPASLLE